MMNGINLSWYDLPHFFSYLKRRGVIFGATVRKRSDGTLREFNGRVETVDFGNALVVVQENNSNGYRSINVAGIQELRAFGETWQFDGSNVRPFLESISEVPANVRR